MGNYQTFSYNIVGNEDLADAGIIMTSEIRSRLQANYLEILANKPGITERILKDVTKYPQIPQFKNQLFVVYQMNDNPTKAYEVNDWIIKEHPDYLYGKLNKAAHLYMKKEYDKMPEVMGELMEIQDLYPNRKSFHVTEVLSYNRVAILYFLGTNNLEAAESRFEIMRDLDRDQVITSSDIKFSEQEIKKYKAENKNNKPNTDSEKEPAGNIGNGKRNYFMTGLPEFNHQELFDLYTNGMNIEHSVIQKILALPRETLIEDLEMILDDCIVRYDLFKSKDWDDSLDNFPLHAIFLLTELKSEQSLQKILNLLRQDEDFLEYWFGDFLTEMLWESVFVTGQNKLEELKQFMFEEERYYYARSEVPAAVAQLALYFPEKRNDVIQWFKDVFDYFLENMENTGVIDGVLLGLMVNDVLDIEGNELKQELELLFENFIITDGLYYLEWRDTKKLLLQPGPVKSRKRKIFTIYDRYENILKTWDSYNNEDQEDDEFDEPFHDISPGRTAQKTGRNDPCPCGSGKKYKKCCLNKLDNLTVH